MRRQVREIYEYREMLKNLVAKELRTRYKGSVLGFLWTFFNPLFLLIIYSTVFSFVMRVQIENYTMFLFVALLPWNYLASSVLQGLVSIVQNGSLVKKIYFPREVLPLSIVMTNLINYLLSLLILLPALIIFKVRLTPALFAFPLILGVETLLVASLVLLLSVANVYFRDLEHIAGIIITAWFFLTPVFYPASIIPLKLKAFFYLNPITPVIESFRNVFFYGTWPEWNSLGILALGSLILLFLSLAIFEHFQKAVAEEI
ncbi:MAG: ABC-2 type transporter [Desulfotomaculum sp. 46_296]|nr:MAG: ABC-2 type transporter [Desulfotomaculum sp. 46_296]HAU32591.1 ABC transporter permease [Desulfotomaculum sp.]